VAPYSSHLMCTAPVHCIWLQYNDVRLPYDSPKLPYGAYGSSLMPDDSCTYSAMGFSMVPHGFNMVPHGSHTAPMWIIQLPQGTIHLPCGIIWSSFGAHGSNMAHTWFSRCTFGSHLPYGSHTVHAAPIWCTRLPYSTHGSHIEHTTPMWPSQGTCSFHMVPCASHMVPSTSSMAHAAPTQHTQLPHGPHVSRSAPR
jgi:hypothetical protein